MIRLVALMLPRAPHSHMAAAENPFRCPVLRPTERSMLMIVGRSRTSIAWSCPMRTTPVVMAQTLERCYIREKMGKMMIIATDIRIARMNIPLSRI